MAFSDSLYLVVIFFVLVVTVLTADYVWTAISATPIMDDVPESVDNSTTATWENTTNFMDTSFQALFLIFAVVGIGLTILLASHPFMLVAWMLVNLVILFIYDTLCDFLTVFQTSDLNTGAMDVAIAFIENDMAKTIVLINILIGAVLFGKRVFVQ